MLASLRRRYLDVLCSVYIFNEHRGYISLDRVLVALRARHPEALELIAAVESHRADERRHYLMFRRWFERQGRMPLVVDQRAAHIDRLIRLLFGCDVDGLEVARVIASEQLFARLCRAIVLTEQRGMWQVEQLLAMRAIQREPTLTRIFRVIARDEPDHWLPYDGWLQGRGQARPSLGERLADWWVHKWLVLVKLPALFLNPVAARRTTWLDAGEAA